MSFFGWFRNVTNEQVPAYAVFDDYRYTQRIAVWVRWFLIAVWLSLHNYRAEIPELSLTSDFVAMNLLVISVGILNAYLHWRIVTDRPLTLPYVIAMSTMDLAIITIGISITSAFRNTFFVLYYPALLGLALVSPSRRLTFGVTAVVAVSYAAISFGMAEPPIIAEKEERILIIRIATMFAVVAVAQLMARIELDRRRQAVEAEQERAAENLELQRKTQEAELAAQTERSRIAREIHDGIAQSIYALSLNLETCADLAEQVEGPLHDQLEKLVPLAKKTLLESRHYIYDLKPLLAGERDIAAIAENQVREFRTVAGIPIQLEVQGEPVEVSVTVASAFYRILQEALANVLKHASASKVDIGLAYERDRIRLSVRDDGVGFESTGIRPGYGLQNMRQRAEELAGCFGIAGTPGGGTRINVELPAQGVEA